MSSARMMNPAQTAWQTVGGKLFSPAFCRILSALSQVECQFLLKKIGSPAEALTLTFLFLFFIMVTAAQLPYMLHTEYNTNIYNCQGFSEDFYVPRKK